MTIDLKQNNRGLVVLAAGGTGGHLFPAQALAEELARRRIMVCLMSDERVGKYGNDFPALKTFIIPAATITMRKPWKIPGQVYTLFKGYRRARKILREIKPGAVIGFGGYPSLAPLFASLALKIPSAIHEQNAVMGRANNAIVRRINVIASSFEKITNLHSSYEKKVVLTGNPVRKMVLQAAQIDYHPPAADEPFNLLVFGGSQGAQFFSRFTPALMKELPAAVRERLVLTQQCRREDLADVQAAYDEMGLKADLQTFFTDMPARIAKAHLVICRSGASSVAELGAIGRPAVYVPLPHALDNDQLRNAEAFDKGGAGWLWRQENMTPDRFAAFFTRLRYEQDELNEAAHAARLMGRPDAAARLADVIVKMM